MPIYRDSPPSADRAHPRREILVGAAKCMANQLSIARAALDTAFQCRTDEQKDRFATRLFVPQDFGGQRRHLQLGLRHVNTTLKAFECHVYRCKTIRRKGQER